MNKLYRMKEENNKIQDSTHHIKKKNGILYVVSTPIGNLEDITLRALKTLKTVDLIAAENIQHTKGLCRHHGVHTRLTSYNQHNRRHKGPELIKRLNSGVHIALVTNAGTPAISDPGSMLVDMALNEDIRVSPIPGPSAVIAALSASGMQVDRFLFLGFLSNKTNKRKKELATISHENRTLVFYEAPHRVVAMLDDLKTVLGDRQIVVLRELTKVYEEIKRGTVGSILEELQKNDIRGEFTLVVAGKRDDNEKSVSNVDLRKEIEKIIIKGDEGIRDLSTRISKEKGLTYRTVYKECLAVKKAVKEKS
jgi:16S rRNA (cytidine1402-2'-O)-methyltransferase